MDLLISKPMLRDILDPTVPPHDQCRLTEQQRTNLAWFLAESKKEKIAPWAIGCFDLNRGPGKGFQPMYRLDDAVMCLQTHNDMWLHSLGPAEPQFARYLTCEERFRLQGLDANLCALLPGKCARMKAAGNAMAVPAVGCAIAFTFEDFLHI